MDEINLFDYLNTLRRRKWTIIWTMIVTMALTGIVLILMPRTYEGETTLLFPEQADLGLSSQLAELAGFMLPGGLTSLSGEGVYITILKSRTLAESVCERLGLDKYDLDYEDLQEDCISVEKPKDGGLLVTCSVPTSWLSKYVEKGKLRDRTAKLAADIANAYISELKAFDRANNLFLGRKNRVYIEDQLARTKVELSDAEERLRKFQEAHPTLIPPEKASSYAEKALELTTERTEADIALQAARAQVAQARATWAARAPEGISPESVIDSPTISELRTELAKLEVERATLLEDFTEEHPDVVSLDQQISKLRQQVNSEVSGVIRGAAGSANPAHQELLKELVLGEIERDGLESRLSAIGKATADLEKQLAGLPVDEMQYARLIRDVKTAEAIYTTLLAEHAKARVSEGRNTDNFIVLDDAIVPKKPAKPRVKLALAASVMLGFMLGTLLATMQGVPRRK